MKYQPMEMKMVLTRLNDALRAGRSEVEITLKLRTVEVKMPFRAKSRNPVAYFLGAAAGSFAFASLPSG